MTYQYKTALSDHQRARHAMQKLGRFEGDGRIKLRAVQPQPNGARPLPLSRATCRKIITLFINSDAPYYSSTGGTLWVVSEYCTNNGMPFRVSAVDGCFVLDKK